jgi:primosomal protein N' (replication factor Y)
MRYVQVAFPRSPLDELTYSVPDTIPPVEEGMRVLVPVGSRFQTGFIVNGNVEVETVGRIRPVADLLDHENLFSPVMLKLTRWMADYYMAEWVDFLKSALPPGLDLQPETVVSILPPGQIHADEHPLLQQLSEKKRLPLNEIYRLFGHRGTFSRIRELEQKEYVQVLAERRPRRHAYNMVEIVRAAAPPSGGKEKELYEYLAGTGAPVWIEDVRSRFPSASRNIPKMIRRGLVRSFWLPLGPRNLWPPLQQILRLNEAQQRAHDAVLARMDRFCVFLLHGVTGSGKTEVYLRLAQQALASGKSVLVLVPEIALLPLFAYRAEESLRRTVSILHSELTERERAEEWRRVHRGEARLVIGTRSALFAPLHSVGLIVMDEEHDGSFKQKEYPRYHARESAIMRASYENCPIVLGSATPALESFFNAGNGKYEYLSLPYRVEKREMPEVRLIDMKEEFREGGDPVFSRFLLEQIRERLRRKEQAIILQNRRGYASLLMCRLCGSVLECPNCSVTLTYHKGPNRLRCHYCDYSRIAPQKCEKCGSIFLHYFGTGTEKLVEMLKTMFPDARIQQFDRDATRARGSVSRILSSFAKREIDILVGTQMLAKGHDFPDVTLVGVVGADSAIGMPDFRATERLFQLITQVAGRSGRGTSRGLVIIQSFQPDHYAIRTSLAQKYETFYEKEIRFRRLVRYPPYVFLANIIFSAVQASDALREARDFAKLILAFKREATRLIGPAIAPIARLSGKHRFQILVKSESRRDLHDSLRNAVEHYQAEKRRKVAQFSIDIDPQSIV